MELCSNFSSSYPCDEEDHSTFSWICPPFHHRPEGYSEWTFQENKIFEKALANLHDDLDSVDSSEKTIVNGLNNVVVPGKTNEEIRQHFQLLLEDVRSIETYGGPITIYGATPPSNHHKTTGNIKRESVCSRSHRISSGDDQNPQKKKGTRWTKEEHEKFLLGLSKYGKGNWRSISRNIVLTRTPTQVASHAQKYFIQLAKISSSKLFSKSTNSSF